MSVYTIQPSFSGGEFSPSLYSRVDVAKYSTGLKKLKNMIVHPHGGVSNRGGLEFITQSKIDDPILRIRLIPFEYSIDTAYVLEFGHLYIRVIKDGGLVLEYEDGPVFSLVTTYREEHIKDIKFTQSVDVLYLFHPEYPPKMVTRFASNAWTISDFEFEEGPFMPLKNTDPVLLKKLDGSAFGLGVKGDIIRLNTYGLSYFKLGHVGSLVKISQHSEGSSFTKTFTSNSTATQNLIVKGTWRLGTRGTWAGVVSILKNGQVLKSFSHNSADFNLDVTGFEDEPCTMTVKMTGWGGSGSCDADLSCDAFFMDGVLKITEWEDVDNVKVKIMKPVHDAYELVSWQEGSWSIKRGFPSCVAFYQDRLVAAATPSEPQTVWPSKTGNYVNFGISSPLEDTDSMSVNIPSRKMNSIKNLLALSEILAFTSASECGIGENGGVFSPTTVRTRTFGYRGSSGTEPVVIGNRAIMVQAMGSVVRDFGYDYSADGYTGNDLSIFSTHLFKDKNITEMAFQQEPDSIVWCVRNDGILLSLTYVKEQDVVAWAWHETDGQFESICSIPGNGQNDVYVVVKRGTKRFIERMARRLPSPTSEESFFLDSGLTYRGVATTTISGLGHLEGKVVSALCDGFVVKNLTVTSGSITLPVAAEVVHVGLPYVSDLQTLSIQVPFNDGSSYGRKVKVSEAKISFLNSRGGFMGPDADTLDEIIELSGASLTDVKALYTGDYVQTMNSNYDEGGTVFYRQSDPLPVTILSIMPKITQGG